MHPASNAECIGDDNWLIVPTLASCVTLGKLYQLPKPQFPDLKDDDKSIDEVGLLGGLSDRKHVKALTPGLGLRCMQSMAELVDFVWSLPWQRGSFEDN